MSTPPPRKRAVVPAPALLPFVSVRIPPPNGQKEGHVAHCENPAAADALRAHLAASAEAAECDTFYYRPDMHTDAVPRYLRISVTDGRGPGVARETLLALLHDAKVFRGLVLTRLLDTAHELYAPLASLEKVRNVLQSITERARALDALPRFRLTVPKPVPPGDDPSDHAGKHTQHSFPIGASGDLAYLATMLRPYGVVVEVPESSHGPWRAL